MIHFEMTQTMIHCGITQSDHCEIKHLSTLIIPYLLFTIAFPYYVLSMMY